MHPAREDSDDFEEDSTSITSSMINIHPAAKDQSGQLDTVTSELNTYIQLEKEMPESRPIESEVYSLEPDLKLGYWRSNVLGGSPALVSKAPPFPSASTTRIVAPWQFSITFIQKLFITVGDLLTAWRCTRNLLDHIIPSHSPPEKLTC